MTADNSPPATSPSSAVDSERLFNEWLRRFSELQSQGASIQQQAQLAEELGRHNPRLAMRVVRSTKLTGEESRVLMAGVLRSWSVAEPETAWRWVLQEGPQVDGLPDTSLLKVVLNRLATFDSASVITNVEKLILSARDGSGLAAGELAHGAIEALMSTGNDAAAKEAIEQWLHHPMGKRLPAKTLELVSQRLSEHAPTDGATWLASLPTSYARNAAIAVQSERWAQADPAAAVAWASNLRPEDGRLEAMQRAIQSWAQKDTLAAAKWIGANEADPAVDRLIVNLVSEPSLTLRDPHVAAQWAELITDPAARLQAVQQVATLWAGRSPDAARNYVRSTSAISVQDKEQLLKTLPSR